MPPTPPWEAAPREPAAWVDRLRAADPAERKRALDALLALGPRALPALGAALSTPDWQVRLAAARALAALAQGGEPAAVADLAAAAAGEDGRVASTSSAALAALGVKALPGLVRALGHAEPAVVEKAAAALADLGPAAAPALPALEERFGHEQRRVRSAVLGALPAVDGAGDRTVDALLAAGADEAWEGIRTFAASGVRRLLIVFGGTDEEKRGKALEAIRRSRCTTPEIVHALSAALRAGPVPFRIRVAGALAAILRAPEAGALKAELASPSWERRAPAAAACADAGPAGEAFALAALADPEPAVRLCALETLRRRRPPGVATAFVRALRDADPACRAAAAGGLAKLRAAEAVDPLRAVLKDVDETVREKACFALGRTGPAAAGAREELLALAQGGGGAPARRAAVDALGQIGGDPRPLEPLLRSEDPELRSAAELAVARMSGALGPLLRGLVDALGDPNGTARGRAARALARLGAAAAPGVPALIDRLAEPAEERVVDVVRALAGIGSAAAAPALAALRARAVHPGLRDELDRALEEIGTEGPPVATALDAALARARPRIVRIEPGSLAEGGGLKPGDFLMDVDGIPILTAADWPRSLVKALGRMSIRTTFYREGGRVELEAPAGFWGFELEDTLESLAEGHARTPEHAGRAFEYLKKLYLAGDYVRCAEVGRRLHEAQGGTPAEALAGASAVAYGVRAGNPSMVRQGLQWVESYRESSMARWTADFAAIAEYARALGAESAGDRGAARAGYARAAALDGSFAKAVEALARLEERGAGAVAADPSARWVGRLFPLAYTLPWLPSLEPPDGTGAPREFKASPRPLAVVLLARDRNGGPADEQLGRLAVLARQMPLRVHLITSENRREHPAFHDGERALRGSLDVLHDAAGTLPAALDVGAVPAIFFVNGEGVIEEQGSSLTEAMARRMIARAEGRLAWRKAGEALPPPTAAADVWEARLRAFVAVGKGFKPGAEEMKALSDEVKAAYPGLVMDERTLTARLGTAGWPGALPKKELTAAVRSMDARLAEVVAGAKQVRWHESGRAAVLLATSDLPRIVIRLPGPWPDPGAMFRELIAKGGLQGAGDRVRDPQSGRSFAVEIHPVPGGFVPHLVGPGGAKENAVALARAATAFVRAGAVEVGVFPAGVVHPAERWDGLDLLDALTAVVGTRSSGMEVFGLRDTEARDAKTVQRFNRWQLVERPGLQDGQTVDPPGGGGRCLLLSRGDAANPYGVWTLTPV